MAPKSASVLRHDVLTHYSDSDPPRCVRCQVSDVRILTIDHIKGGGSQHRRSLRVQAGLQFYRWLEHEGFPPGYQTLCWNCQIVKRIENHEGGRRSGPVDGTGSGGQVRPRFSVDGYAALYQLQAHYTRATGHHVLADEAVQLALREIDLRERERVEGALRRELGPRLTFPRPA